jgi:uncharacterized protein YjiS (DUF1127 family)
MQNGSLEGARPEDVMSVVPLVSISEERASPRLVQRAYALALRLGALIAREVQVRRDTFRLAELNDYMLHDIGIARADIEGAVRRGRDGSDDAKRSGQIDAPPSMFLPPRR